MTDIQKFKALAEAAHGFDDVHLAPDVVIDVVAEIERIEAEKAALQQRLTVADQRVDDLETDNAKAVDLLNTSYQLFGLNNSLSSYRAQMDDIVEFVAKQLARTEQCQFPQTCPINCGCGPDKEQPCSPY